MTTGSAPSHDYDVVIVGARCAGAATAMLLARRGLRVLAIDRGRYGSDTVSTHALMRAGVVQLSRWGVLDGIKAAGTPVIRSTSFHYGDEVVEVQIKPQNDVDGLYAPRRTVIDRVLVDAARRAGAEIAFETHLIDLVRAGNGRVCGVRLRDGRAEERQVSAELVIGADGVIDGRSSRRRGMLSNRPSCHRRDLQLLGRHGIRRISLVLPPGVSAGAIPTNGGHTCIFASVPQSRFHETLRRGADAGYRHVMRECGSDLAAIVERSERVEKYRAFAGEVGFFRQSFGPGWALVGDAGYFKDPLTAHGITDALIDAELLAQAAAAGTDTAFAGYQRARDKLAVDHFEVTDAIASFEWDLPKVQQLHRALSDEMKKESLAVASFDLRWRSQIIGKVIDELARVVLGTIDECRLAASKDRQSEGIQARRIDDASVVPQVSFVINHRARPASCSRVGIPSPRQSNGSLRSADRASAATTPARVSARSVPEGPTSASREWLRAHSSNVSSSRFHLQSASAN